MAPAGFGVTSSAMVEAAVHHILCQPYLGQELSIQPVTDLVPAEENFNLEIWTPEPKNRLVMSWDEVSLPYRVTATIP